MAGPQDDDNIGRFNAESYAEQNRNSSLKFPRVPVLNADGHPTGQTISPAEYDEDTHKDHIGCPCCLAKLIAAGSKTEEDGSYKIQGTFDGQRYFRSQQLKDHEEACPFGHEDAGVRSRAFKMLEFLNTDGRKRLNWNFKNNRDPQYSEHHEDVALKRYNETPAQMRARLSNIEAIDPKSYDATCSVKTAREVSGMVAMIRTMDDPAAVYDSIDVISEGKAVPLSEMIAGEDWVGLGASTQMREELGLSMPSVIAADTKDAEVITDFAGHTFIVPPMMRGGDDANGDIQAYKLLIDTTDPKAAEALMRGDKVAIQGYADLNAPMTSRPEFFELTGFKPESDTMKYMVVHVRNADHVSPITQDFETEMERKPAYRDDYLQSINPEPEEPENGWDWGNDDI